jgi:hypothetical protein
MADVERKAVGRRAVSLLVLPLLAAEELCLSRPVGSVVVSPFSAMLGCRVNVGVEVLEGAAEKEADGVSEGVIPDADEDKEETAGVADDCERWRMVTGSAGL